MRTLTATEMGVVTGASEKYPDNRWLLSLGATDPNAGPRADDARDSIKAACQSPPAS